MPISLSVDPFPRTDLHSSAWQAKSQRETSGCPAVKSLHQHQFRFLTHTGQ